jgi:hypothetical protein
MGERVDEIVQLVNTRALRIMESRRATQLWRSQNSSSTYGVSAWTTQS